MKARARLIFLRRQLRETAAHILALPSLAARPLRRALRLRARDDSHEVTVTVTPRGHAPPGAGLPGAWFSPDEQRIWEALAAGPLRGPDLSSKLGEKIGGRFSTLLSNLVERGCLHTGPKGYVRAEPP